MKDPFLMTFFFNKNPDKNPKKSPRRKRGRIENSL